MAERPLFSDSLNAIVKGVSIVAGALLIQNGVAEDIVAIANLRAYPLGKDLQHKMRGINQGAAIAFRLLQFRSASQPNCLHSSLPEDPPRFGLRCPPLTA